MRHVLFAAPDHLHRQAGKLPGDRHRLAHMVLRAAAPAEAAAGVVAVDLALRQRQAGGFGQGGMRGLGVLCRHPGLGAVGADTCGAVHGLHRGVGQEGRGIDRLNLFGRTGDGPQRIALVAVGIGIGGVQALGDALGEHGAGLAGTVALVPDQRQLPAARPARCRCSPGHPGGARPQGGSPFADLCCPAAPGPGRANLARKPRSMRSFQCHSQRPCAARPLQAPMARPSAVASSAR